jgi:hypothetical protein
MLASKQSDEDDVTYVNVSSTRTFGIASVSAKSIPNPKESDIIKGNPGYVIKLKNVHSKNIYDKVFINVFFSDQLSDHEVHQRMNHQDFLVSPDQILVNDNKNQPCFTYNVIISSLLYNDNERSPTHKEKVSEQT